jgi:glycosyltransferase involved in cell wall biosynthesis
VTFVHAGPLTTVPTVSVVVPCYNYGRYLPQLVQYVRDQPSVEVQIIIVDDASPDGSAEVAQSLADNNDQITLIRHATNRGHIQTYNDGLAAAQGDYVILLSADDLLPPGAITRAVALMEAHPTVGLSYGWADSFSGEPPVVRAKVRNWRIWRGIDWLSLSARRGRSFISSPEVVMRISALRQVGYYDPRLPHSGDLDMWLRTALTWDIGRVNGPAQALYRVHDSNMHLTAYAGWLTDLHERHKTFDLLFNEHAPYRSIVTSLRPRTMRALAKESLRRALIAHRDNAPREVVNEYVRFAVQTDPTVESTPWWQLCRLGPITGASYPGLSARRFISRARLHSQWRRARRYGT